MDRDIKKYDIFQTISDPTLRKLLELIAGKQLPITAISRTAVTKHLHILESADLVSLRKIGREKLYCLQGAPLQKLLTWLAT